MHARREIHWPWKINCTQHTYNITRFYAMSHPLRHQYTIEIIRPVWITNETTLQAKRPRDHGLIPGRGKRLSRPINRADRRCDQPRLFVEHSRSLVPRLRMWGAIPQLPRVFAVCLSFLTNLVIRQEKKTHTHTHTQESQCLQITKIWIKDCPYGSLYKNIYNISWLFAGSHFDNWNRCSSHTARCSKSWRGGGD